MHVDVRPMSMVVTLTFNEAKFINAQVKDEFVHSTGQKLVHVRLTLRIVLEQDFAEPILPIEAYEHIT